MVFDKFKRREFAGKTICFLALNQINIQINHNENDTNSLIITVSSPSPSKNSFISFFVIDEASFFKTDDPTPEVGPILKILELQKFLNKNRKKTYEYLECQYYQLIFPIHSQFFFEFLSYFLVFHGILYCIDQLIVMWIGNHFQSQQLEQNMSGGK